MHIVQSRRDFLASLSAAGAAGVLGARRSFADEQPLETTTVRLAKIPGICIAPQYLAEELLAAEGFTDIRYVQLPAAIQHTAIARGEIDFSLHFSAPLVIPIDAGDPITSSPACIPAASKYSATSTPAVSPTSRVREWAYRPWVRLRMCS